MTAEAIDGRRTGTTDKIQTDTIGTLVLLGREARREVGGGTTTVVETVDGAVLAREAQHVGAGVVDEVVEAGISKPYLWAICRFQKYPFFFHPFSGC